MSRAVMQQALEALEVMWRHFSSARLGEYTVTDYATRNAAYAAIYQLRVVLAEPEQEPDGISWLKRDSGYFTAPTPRKPVELTDEQIVQVLGSVRESITGSVFLAFARAIERAHGITGETK